MYTLKAILIIGDTRYEKLLKSMEMTKPIYKIFPITEKQLNSDQWLSQNGWMKLDEEK